MHAAQEPRSKAPERWMLAFAASVFVFHQLPALLFRQAADVVDLLTPFAVIGSSVALLVVLRAQRAAITVALIAGIAYVDGHGMHLAANSINEAWVPPSEARKVAYFWDETFSHVESLFGWFGLVGSFCVAASSAPEGADLPAARGILALAAVVLGFTFFTSTVEGQTWELLLGVTPAFVVWAVARRRPIVVCAGAAFVVGALGVGIWALVNGGVPEFSKVGWI